MGSPAELSVPTADGTGACGFAPLWSNRDRIVTVCCCASIGMYVNVKSTSKNARIFFCIIFIDPLLGSVICRDELRLVRASRKSKHKIQLHPIIRFHQRDRRSAFCGFM